MRPRHWTTEHSSLRGGPNEESVSVRATETGFYPMGRPLGPIL